MNRSERRHREQRAKERARRRFKTWGEWGADKAKDPRDIGRAAHTPHPCSNPACCGNARTTEGETFQERCADMKLRESEDDTVFDVEGGLYTPHYINRRHIK